MRNLYRFLLIVCALALTSAMAQAQTPQHFTFTSGTGNNATVAIPTSANPNVNGTPLVAGDEIGVFSPGGLCCGAVVWTGQNAAVTVWGDNDQTPAIDGMRAGEQMRYRIWRQATNREDDDEMTVTYAQGNGLYAANGIFVLSALTVSVAERAVSSVLEEYVLTQNYPNPFNPSTAISFQLPTASEVSLVIYDLNGQVVKQLASGKFARGKHSLEWEGRNESGARVASGVYVYKLQAGEFVAQKKLVLMK